MTPGIDIMKMFTIHNVCSSSIKPIYWDWASWYNTSMDWVFTKCLPYFYSAYVS